jgi:Cdc6-like AAA superfamily ATPase
LGNIKLIALDSGLVREDTDIQLEFVQERNYNNQSTHTNVSTVEDKETGVSKSPDYEIEWIGNEDYMKLAKLQLTKIKNGKKPKSLLLVGPRGTGKTLFVNDLTQYAEKLGVSYEWVTQSSGRDSRRFLKRI